MTRYFTDPLVSIRTSPVSYEQAMQPVAGGAGEVGAVECEVRLLGLANDVEISW